MAYNFPSRSLFAVPFLASLLAVGCVDPPEGGDTGVTPLYAYDEANKVVMVWNDVNTIHDVAEGKQEAPPPDRTITSSLFKSMGTLAWGGMVYSPSGNQLFLVSESGTVVRVEQAHRQSGSLAQGLDIGTFTLGNASKDRLPSSVFSQAAVDPSSGALYVAETGSNAQSRIWVVAGAGRIASNSPMPTVTFVENPSPDTGGSGVAAGSTGNVFGFFTGGSGVVTPLLESVGGPRIRLASGRHAFHPLQNVLAGDQTKLWDGTTAPAHGTLAFDSTQNILYAARPHSSGNAVVAFNQGAFSSGSQNQAPAHVLKDKGKDLPSLRFISHARTKDWLAGADQDGADGKGAPRLHLWKGPSKGEASRTFTLPTPASGSPVAIRGLALDGSR